MQDDDDLEDDGPAPVGVYLTPAGYARLSAELHQLMKVERPKVVEIVSWAAGNGDRSENGDYLYGKKRLREIDKRGRFLTKRLRAAQVIDPAQTPDKSRVFFGATVKFVNEEDLERVVTIVGAEECDFARGEVSLLSPIARALMRAQVNDSVTMHGPNGPSILEILEINYAPKTS